MAQARRSDNHGRTGTWGAHVFKVGDAGNRILSRFIFQFEPLAWGHNHVFLFEAKIPLTVVFGDPGPAHRPSTSHGHIYAHVQLPAAGTAILEHVNPFIRKVLDRRKHGVCVLIKRADQQAAKPGVFEGLQLPVNLRLADRTP